MINDYLGSCKDCRFWDGNINNESWLPDYGFCHRHPPAPITQAELYEPPENLDKFSKELMDFLMDRKTRFMHLFGRPVTESEDFCGEWSPNRT